MKIKRIKFQLLAGKASAAHLHVYGQQSPTQYVRFAPSHQTVCLARKCDYARPASTTTVTLRQRNNHIVAQLKLHLCLLKGQACQPQHWIQSSIRINSQKAKLRSHSRLRNSRTRPAAPRLQLSTGNGAQYTSYRHTWTASHLKTTTTTCQQRPARLIGQL